MQKPSDIIKDRINSLPFIEGEYVSHRTMREIKVIVDYVGEYLDKLHEKKGEV